MLRLLRKIKPGKPAGENSGSFWRFAIAESVLIFLGILLALQVDNWNQERKDRKLEKVLLHELLANLKSDLKDVEVNLNIHNRSLTSHQIVLAFIEGEEPFHDSLETHFGYLNDGTIFNENISTYESLKSTGIDLIKNDTLRQQITHLYSVAYDAVLSLEQIAHKHTIEVMNPVISEHLYTIDVLDRARPLDISKIRKSNGFRHCLKLNVVYLEHQLKSYYTVKDQIIKLIGDIDIVLNN